MNYRLYSFVANLYLSPLQQGIQTAHVVSELARGEPHAKPHPAFSHWAENDKTIIVCGASNHAGVMSTYEQLCNFSRQLDLPIAIFREDEQSMNGMATACGIIVPEYYWGAQFDRQVDTGIADRWVWAEADENGKVIAMQAYPMTDTKGQFCSFLKSFRLA